VVSRVKVIDMGFVKHRIRHRVGTVISDVLKTGICNGQVQSDKLDLH
jgi:hypothetical protein